MYSFSCPRSHKQLRHEDSFAGTVDWCCNSIWAIVAIVLIFGCGKHQTDTDKSPSPAYEGGYEFSLCAKEYGQSYAESKFSDSPEHMGAYRQGSSSYYEYLKGYVDAASGKPPNPAFCSQDFIRRIPGATKIADEADAKDVPAAKTHEPEKPSELEKSDKKKGQAEHVAVAAGQQRSECIAKVRDGRCAPDEAASIIAESGVDAVPELLALLRPNPLDEPNARLQVFAVMALGNIGAAAREAVPTLTDILAQHELQLHALRALGKIGAPARSSISAMFLQCREVPSAQSILEAAFDRIDPRAGQLYRQLQLLQSKLEMLKSQERLAQSKANYAETMGSSPEKVGDLAREVAAKAMETIPVIKEIERITLALLSWEHHSETLLPPSVERSLGTPSRLKELTVDLGNGVKLEMLLIPAGEFYMGSSDSDINAMNLEKPQHRVRITKPFYLGKYLVTQEQWETLMGSNPSQFKGPRNPVEQVSWEDCQEFLSKLNAKSGSGSGKFQLPTEAQWEYACRAGSKTRYCFGDEEAMLGNYAWHSANSGSKTNPVGEKKPNDWGLYDMHGNVWEWCQDWYGNGYYGNSPTDDPKGPRTGSDHVGRGGSWDDPATACRSATRSTGEVGSRNNFLGLRVSHVRTDSATDGGDQKVSSQEATRHPLNEADESKLKSNPLTQRDGKNSEQKDDAQSRLEQTRIAIIACDRAVAYCRERDYDKAIVECTRAIEVDKNYPRLYSIRGFAYRQRDEFEKTIDDCTRSIELDAHCAVAYSNRGVAYAGQGSFAKALADCTRAIELDNKSAFVYSDRAEVLCREGKYHNAIADSTTAIQLNPKYVEAYNNRGTAYHGLHQFENAIAEYTKAIRIDPHFAAAFANRGVSYRQQDEDEKAIADYTRAIRLDPHCVAAFKNRGFAYSLRGDNDKAIADFTRMIELDPKDKEAYWSRGKCYEASGLTAKAKEDFARFRDLGGLPE